MDVKTLNNIAKEINLKDKSFYGFFNDLKSHVKNNIHVGWSSNNIDWIYSCYYCNLWEMNYRKKTGKKINPKEHKQLINK